MSAIFAGSDARGLLLFPFSTLEFLLVDQVKNELFGGVDSFIKITGDPYSFVFMDQPDPLRFRLSIFQLIGLTLFSDDLSSNGFVRFLSFCTFVYVRPFRYDFHLIKFHIKSIRVGLDFCAESSSNLFKTLGHSL